MAGGPGLILTRESLRRLVTQAFVHRPDCIQDGQGCFKIIPVGHNGHKRSPLTGWPIQV